MQNREWAPSRTGRGWLAPVWTPGGTDGCLEGESARVAGTVNLGVGRGGPGLACSIATTRSSGSKPKDGAGVAVPGPWGDASPLSTDAQLGGFPCWPGPPYAVGFADPIPRRALTGPGSRDDEPGASG